MQACFNAQHNNRPGMPRGREGENDVALMERLAKILKREQASAADLRSEIASIEAELPQARGRLAELKSKRERLLLDASDKELDTLEHEIASASRDLDRMDAAAAVLAKRLHETEQRERHDALRVEVEAVRSAAQEVLADQPRAIEAARFLADFLVRLEVVDRWIGATREAARELEMPDIPSPMSSVHGNYVVRAVIPKLDGSGHTIFPASDAERHAEVARLRSVA